MLSASLLDRLVRCCAEVVVSNNVVQYTRSGLPGLKTQNNIGVTQSLTVTNNRFANNAGVGVYLYCNAGKCSVSGKVSGNTFSGNARTGNYCNGQVRVDNPSQNSIAC